MKWIILALLLAFLILTTTSFYISLEWGEKMVVVNLGKPLVIKSSNTTYVLLGGEVVEVSKDVKIVGD